MKILTISGSAKTKSTNIKLLEALPQLFPNHQFKRFNQLEKLPLFHADCQEQPFPELVKEWQNEIKSANAVIISTPEYIFNLPAILKNALEWVTESGELHDLVNSLMEMQLMVPMVSSSPNHLVIVL